MATRPPRRHYKVRAIPGGSDDTSTHFAVEGPGVHEFAMMDRIAALLEAVLNAADEFSRSKSR